ncbi:MAG: fructose 1,6-bisphosphatase [Candidatus Omnitrophica bacterium]|nr:fructose 1,6-bisphosphatase [Candidatus Omnitrophota bacterium]
MRNGSLKSLVSLVLIVASFTSWSTPSFALRQSQRADSKSGLEEIRVALGDGQNPPTWAWSENGGPISLQQRVSLILEANRNTKGAFDLGRAVAVAGHGKKSKLSKRFEPLSDYLESVIPVELRELVLEGQMKDDPILHQSSLLAQDPQAASILDWVKRNVRFVVVSDQGNGYLAAQGIAGSPEHTAVMAYAGWHAYPHWEKGMEPEMKEAIRRGMRARQQNQSLRPDELPGPPSVYLSETQIRQFMAAKEEGRQVLAIKLAHEIKDILRQGRHEEETPALTRQVNEFLSRNMQAVQQVKEQQAAAARLREQQKLHKFHATVDLTAVVKTNLLSAHARQEIVRAVEDFLHAQQKNGTIFGFNVFLFDGGKMLVVDFDYRLTGELERNPRKLAGYAVERALDQAARLNLLEPDGIPNLQSPETQRLLKFESGEQQLTQRAAEPIVTVQAIGLGMGAFNRAIWHLLVGDVGHLQAIAGDQGFRVRVANLNDIREGKEPRYRIYDFDTPGLSKEQLEQIIQQIERNEITEEDLPGKFSQNLHQLHRLVGAMDEYAIEGVYPLPGSRFAYKVGKETVTLTDEPIIKVHLHPNPVAEFRAQSGGWATGSYQKVLTLPYFAPNADQTRWAGWIPVSNREAEDLTSLDKEGWPRQEMGFVTAWGGSQDRGGTGRGEPPVTDVFGKNDQTEINRKEDMDFLLGVWKDIGDFEPRLTAAEAARRAKEAAEAFPSVEKVPAGVPPVGAWHPIPNLKKGEADPVVESLHGEGKLTWSFFKADIGGKAGHDQVLQTHMAAARAKLAEAKEKGLIKDYTVYFVGDDMQLGILHDKGVHNDEIHAMAWQVFCFGYWVSWNLGLEPYGHGQDIRIAELFSKYPIEQHAKLTRRDVELLKTDFQQVATGWGNVPGPLKANAQLVSTSALDKWDLLDAALKKWESGTTAGTIVTEAVPVGNVTGMGIGWVESDGQDEEPLMIFGLDKSGAGGFNPRLVRTLYKALNAGDLSRDDLVEMWDVEEQKRVFLRMGDHEAQIRGMAAQVNKYNFKRIIEAKTGKILGWLSSEILSKIGHAYVGKDDPILALRQRIGRHMAETFKDVRTAPTPQLGDEAGSHNLANVFRAWWQSFPGEKSNPVGVAITFLVRNGRIESEDEGSKPKYDEGRRRTERFNRIFSAVQGEFSPLVANRKQIEPSYSRAQMLDKADQAPTAWVDRPSVNAGLEENIPPVWVARPEVLAGFEPKGIFFDFDDTLWPGFPRDLEAGSIASWVTGRPNPSPEMVKQVKDFLIETNGMSWRERKEQWRWNLPGDHEAFIERLQTQLRQFIHEHHLTDPRFLTPGASSLLEALKEAGIQMSIVTGGGADSRRQYADGLGIGGFFKQIYGGGEKVATIRQGMRAWGFQPNQVAMVGDGIPDIRAALQNGILAVGFATTPEHRRRLIDAGAQVVIYRDFTALKSILGVLNIRQRPAAGLEEWRGGPFLRLYVRSGDNRTQGNDNRAVIYNFNPSTGDQVWVSLLNRRRRMTTLGAHSTNPLGERVPEDVVIFRGEVMRKILEAAMKNGDLDPKLFEEIWPRGSRSLEFRNPKTLEALNSPWMKESLAFRKQAVLKRKQTHEPKGGLVATYQPGEWVIFFDTAGDNQTLWHPFAEARIFPSSDDSAALSFSALKNVRIDRESRYPSAAGLEEEYRGPTRDGAVILNPDVQGAWPPPADTVRSFIAARPGSQFLLTVFRGPSGNQTWDQKQFYLVRLEKGKKVSFLRPDSIELADFRKPEKIVPVQRVVALPDRVRVRPGAQWETASQPSEGVRIEDLQMSISVEPGKDGLRFQFEQKARDPEAVPPLYLIFPLDAVDAWQTTLQAYRSVSFEVLAALRNRPAKSFQIDKDWVGQSLPSGQVIDQAIALLNEDPTRVLQLQFGARDLFIIKSVGDGSRAWMDAQIDSLKQQLTAGLEESKLKPEDIHILIVDDDLSIQGVINAVVTLLVKLQGIDVSHIHVAGTVDEALTLIEQFKPQFASLDMNLKDPEGRTGIDIARKLKETDPSARAILVALLETDQQIGRKDQELAPGGLLAGFVEKPNIIPPLTMFVNRFLKDRVGSPAAEEAAEPEEIRQARVEVDFARTLLEKTSQGAVDQAELAQYQARLMSAKNKLASLLRQQKEAKAGAEEKKEEAPSQLVVEARAAVRTAGIRLAEATRSYVYTTWRDVETAELDLRRAEVWQSHITPNPIPPETSAGMEEVRADRVKVTPGAKPQLGRVFVQVRDEAVQPWIHLLGSEPIWLSDTLRGASEDLLHQYLGANAGEADIAFVVPSVIREAPDQWNRQFQGYRLPAVEAPLGLIQKLQADELAALLGHLQRVHAERGFMGGVIHLLEISVEEHEGERTLLIRSA